VGAENVKPSNLNSNTHILELINRLNKEMVSNCVIFLTPLIEHILTMDLDNLELCKRVYEHLENVGFEGKVVKEFAVEKVEFRIDDFEIWFMVQGNNQVLGRLKEQARMIRYRKAKVNLNPYQPFTPKRIKYSSVLYKIVLKILNLKFQQTHFMQPNYQNKFSHPHIYFNLFCIVQSNQIIQSS
jgi:hypothetical protein